MINRNVFIKDADGEMVDISNSALDVALQDQHSEIVDLYMCLPGTHCRVRVII